MGLPKKLAQQYLPLPPLEEPHLPSHLSHPLPRASSPQSPALSSLLSQPTHHHPPPPSPPASHTTQAEPSVTILPTAVPSSNATSTATSPPVQVTNAAGHVAVGAGSLFAAGVAVLAAL